MTKNQDAQPTYLSDPSKLRDFDLDLERPLGPITTTMRPEELLGAIRTAHGELVNQHIKNGQLRRENEQLHYEATHDELTDALNRRGLEEYFKTAPTPRAILVVDGTNQKAVNDILGYDRGDKVIQDTYKILQKSTRSSDVIARWGGDEFVVIINDQVAEDAKPVPIEEERRQPQALSSQELIAAATARIYDVTRQFLDDNPDLTNEKVNFDIAVGGAECSADTPLRQLIASTEKSLKAHKAEQHKSGQHRPV